VTGGWPVDPVAAHALAHETPTAAELLFGVRVTGYSATGLEAVCRLPDSPGRLGHLMGRLGTLADMTAGRTVRASVPAGSNVRTANLRLDMTGRGLYPGESVLATGEVTDLCSSHVLGRAEMRAEDGTVVARCTARFVIVPETEQDDAVPPESHSAGGARCLSELFGLGERGRRADGLTLTALPDARSANHYGIMHGGAQVALADVASAAALRLSAGDGQEPVDTTVRCLRPILIDGTPLVLDAAIEKAGRRATVTRVSCRDGRGRLLMTAESTYVSSGAPALGDL
jgi:uncharacterized protein (TIGR00369 family)